MQTLFTKRMDFKDKERLHITIFNLFLFCFSQSELEPEYFFPNSTIKNPHYFFPLPTQTKKEKKRSHVMSLLELRSSVVSNFKVRVLARSFRENMSILGG